MPIQDTDDLQYEAPRPPSFAERWLRRIFVEDFKLKLLSLGITLVLWFAVTGQRKPQTKRLPGVQLTFIHAENMGISNDPPTRVDVTISGSKDEVDPLDPRNLLATVVVGDQGIGNRVVRLSRDSVKIDQLPTGVRVVGFQPSVVSLRLEPKIERQIDLNFKFEGNVPEGYEMRAATANPAKVRVRGPASVINAIQSASTESILLEAKTSSFDLNQVAVDIPNEKIDVLDGVVQVHVEIGPRSTDKPVSSPTARPLAKN